MLPTVFKRVSSRQGSKPRIAVVSPFIDKRHGTEKYVAEWLCRLTEQFEIHVYSQRVDDLDLSRIRWHRISKIKGPHMLNYLWWFAANHLRRTFDSLQGLRFDLIYSPGINCLNADLVSVHIVFAELLRNGGQRHLFAGLSGIRRIHQQVYYRLIRALESRVYRNQRTGLIPMTRKTADSLRSIYQRAATFPPILFGLDADVFNPARRVRLRERARKEFGLAGGDFVMLLIGNGWRNKGLASVVQAMKMVRDARVHLLAVGNEDPRAFAGEIRKCALDSQIHFLPKRADVEVFYAAADMYVAPSREDALPLPAAEAMACGLPVAVSTGCGISELISDAENGFLLRQPPYAEELAEKILLLQQNSTMLCRMGQTACRRVAQYSWEDNAWRFADCVSQTLAKKNLAVASIKQEV